MPLVVDQDVGGLQVAVHDAVLVQVLQHTWKQRLQVSPHPLNCSRWFQCHRCSR